MIKYTKVYMFGGTNGKDDSTDYLIGYLCSNGKYIDKRTSALDSDIWYSCDGYFFSTLNDAKRYVSRFAE